MAPRRPVRRAGGGAGISTGSIFPVQGWALAFKKAGLYPRPSKGKDKEARMHWQVEHKLLKT